MENKRLESLDAFRGFDMMWIMGLASIVVAVCSLFPGGENCALATQMEHVEWNGLAFMDLIYLPFHRRHLLSIFICQAEIAEPQQRPDSRENLQARCCPRTVRTYLQRPSEQF